MTRWWEVGVGIGLLCVASGAWAADGPATEAERATLRAGIEGEIDPQLREVMLELLEAGELDHLTVDRDAPPGTSAGLGEGTVGAPTPSEGGTGDSLPPEARERLEKLFEEKGTGDPARDAHVREEAEQILREYGIEPREGWADHDGDWEDGREEGEFIGNEHWGREGLGDEQYRGGEFHNEWGNDSLTGGNDSLTDRGGELPDTVQESLERDHAFEAYREHEVELPQREVETVIHEYEAPTVEPMEHPEFDMTPPEHEDPDGGYPQP